MKMRLVFIFAAIAAISLAEKVEANKPIIEDSEAAESVELLKESHDLKAEASAYNYVPQQTWTQPQKYVPQQTWTSPPNTYVPPVTASPQAPQYDYPQNPHYYPYPTYQTYPTYRPTSPTWTPTPHPVYSTTTPVAVIKNEQFYGDNGSYKYEYQIADGTHVGEEGYFTDPKRSDESLVKKGWYSYKGADGKVYTVTYWADHTGFHAYGDHLPTPPPVPPAIQAAIDQSAKEEAEKQKPTENPWQKPTYYPTQKPIYYPTQAPIYYPPQPTYYPSYGKK